MTKSLNELLTQLRGDRALIRQGTERVQTLENDLARLQELNDHVPAAPTTTDAASPAIAEAPPQVPRPSAVHVCGPRCPEYAYHGTPELASESPEQETVPEPQASPPEPRPRARSRAPISHAAARQASLALSWLDHLLDRIPPAAIHSFLAFYRDAGCVDERTAAWLLPLADGVIPAATRAPPMDVVVPDALERARLHRANLVALARLSGTDLGGAAIRRLELGLRRTLGQRKTRGR